MLRRFRKISRPTRSKTWTQQELGVKLRLDLGILMNEVANRGVHLIAFLMNHPMCSVGDALDGQLGNELVEAVQILSREGCVLSRPR